MSKELEDLKVQVTRMTTVSKSATTLINGLAAQIIDLKDDPVALVALAEELKAEATSLGDSVTANTPTPP